MKITIGRNITTKVHWILDNLLLPVLRECRPLMKLLSWIIYGKYGKLYLDFKNKGNYLHLTPEEFKNYYVAVEPIITRPTDINKKCLALLDKEISLIDTELSRDNSPDKVKILDISCGRGFLSERLAKNNPDKEIYGVDINIMENEKNNKISNLHYVEGSIEQIPFEDNYFDCVISTHTIEHIIYAHRAVKELRRVCKDKLIIIVPCQREYKYTMDFHVQFFPYVHSLQQFMGNVNSFCEKAGGDLYYREKVTDKVKQLF